MIPTSAHIRSVSWREHAAEISALRRRVFIDEQGVSEAEEWDGHDENAQHLLVMSSLNESLGTARIVIRQADSGARYCEYHIGRVAILPEHRGQGLGTRLMHAALAQCRRHAEHPNPAVHLNAQLERLAFYSRLGFVARGEVFMDAGIAHRAMTLPLYGDLP